MNRLSNGSNQNEYVQSCIKRLLDPNSYAKLQQVLDFLEGDDHGALYKCYNDYLVEDLKALKNSQLPPGYDATWHIQLRVKFYSIRFIGNVGKGIIDRISKDGKAQRHFISLTKVLLFHALVAKCDSANLALVELQQLCQKCQITLQELFYRNRITFLRLIIKAILHKLTLTANEAHNDTASQSKRSSWSNRGNYVITYMTRAFEVFNVTTITKADLAQSLIIITILIHDDKYIEAIKLFLHYFALHQNITPSDLVRNNIQDIIVGLLLKRKLSNFDLTDALNKLCCFCNIESLKEVLVNKFTSIKAQLLLHYSINPKSVTESIYYLSTIEKEEHEQPFADEFEDESTFIEYLNPSIIGILLGVDSYFNSNRNDLDSDHGIKFIESLCILIRLIDATRVQTVHIKLLSTLSLLLGLRRRRDNQALNKAIIRLWSIFVEKISGDLKKSLMINICVALSDLLEDCPEEVAGIYESVICRENSPKMADQLKCLFFIPNLPSLKRVYAYLTPYVCRKNSVSSLKELQQSLDCVLPLLKFENQKCRLIAFRKIKQLLESNQNLLLSNMLLNQGEPLDNLTSKIIEFSISLSSTHDLECSALIAECLGILGAVNPIRLDHLIYGGQMPQQDISVTNLLDPPFLADLIERLKNSLFSDQRSESEIANYALQVVVKLFSVFKDDTIKGKLSNEAIKACQLCQNTNYSAVKKASPDTSTPVFEKFKYENQYSYREWLDKFSLNLISLIRNRQIQELLNACSYVFRYNLKLAEHLLPHAIIYIILNEPTNVAVVKAEFMSILDEDVGVSTQDLDTVYSKDARDNLKTLNFQCANLVFCALDAVYRLDCNTKGKEPLIRIRPNQQESLREFLESMPKDKLGILASKCRAHARALRYFDQYLFQSKDQLDKYATNLQKIYVALDDTYEAAGVEMVRTLPPAINDDIGNYEARGKFDKAFMCCVTLLESSNGETRDTLIEDSLRCLSNQGDYLRLYEKSKEFLSEYPDSNVNILSHMIESTWKLGRWGELDDVFNKRKWQDKILEIAPVSQGYLLKSVNEGSDLIRDRLKIVRQKLLKPLSIAMLDRSAYFRGYQSLLALHSIGDFALALDLLDRNVAELDENSVDTLRPLLNQRVSTLFETWDKRNKLVQPSLRSLEPLLVWQRAMSLTLSNRYRFLEDRINIDVGKMWLTSVEAAREARSFDRSCFCLIQAQKCFGTDFEELSLDLRVRYHIEKAKLEWDQGDQTKAIKGLKSTLEKFKDHKLYEHLELRKKENLEKEKKRKADAKKSGKELKEESEIFPDINNLEPCLECLKVKHSDRESFAKLKMLITTYSEEAAAEIPGTLFFMYEECVHLAVNQEETYFRLARYYDRLLNYYIENPTLCGEIAEEKNLFDATQRFSQNLASGDKEDVYTKLMEHSIIAFGNSLKYGVTYLRESMPRLLNIWYDLGSKKPRSAQTSTRVISSRIENTTRFIDELKGKHLPPYYFMTAISLLLSRVSHPHSGVSKKTCEILELLLEKYPHQITWQMIAMYNDSENDERKRAARHILTSFKRNKSQKLEKVVRDTLKFSDVIYELSLNHGPNDKTRPDGKKKKLTGDVKIKDVSDKAAAFNFSQCRVIVPTEASIRAIIPMDNSCESLDKHVVFPEANLSYVKEFIPKVHIFNSLCQPRQVSFLCENGRTISIICKSGDDLRKDNRCVEFFDLLNRILRKDRLTNARFFEIQTYLVLPIADKAGIIEMVPNCVTLRSICDSLYKERNPKFVMNDLVPKKTKDGALDDVYAFFSKCLASKRPVVLPTWFLRKFTEPTSWYMARLAYTRTTAVVSMGGYIIGLGDRHLDNILIDTRNGRVVHVDFNLLFHQGETLAAPEVVPFRLTQNVVAAFGSMGTEGNFRNVCEVTMRVMRKEKDALLTTLKPFMHDPCSDWIKARDARDRFSRVDQEDRHAENKSAKFRIEVTERKLKGFPRSKKFKPLTLIDSYSIEAQVDNLIQEASDDANLAIMYFGWCPAV